jgi:hypothetical protein
MMPLFDQNSDLVAWTNGAYVWSPDMDWIAWITGGHAWSAVSGNWLGQTDGGAFRDQSGRPVMWGHGADIVGTAQPA